MRLPGTISARPESPSISINHWFADHSWAAVPACYWYAAAHYLVTLTVLVWLFRKGDGEDDATGDLSWHLHGLFA